MNHNEKLDNDECGKCRKKGMFILQSCLLFGSLLFAVPAFGYSTEILTPDSISSSFIQAINVEQGNPADEPWWLLFNDTTLTKLIDLGISNNYNLKSAIKRVEAARQMLRGVRAGYYPTIGIYTGLDYNKDSDREKLPYVKENDNSSFNLGATLSWEIDIFGRVREKAKGSQASLNATRIEYEGMMLSLAAEIAQSYSNLRMYERQLAVARKHIASQTEMLRIVEARYDAGLVSKLDVAQARNTLNTTRLLIPSIEANIMSTEYALSTICGVNIEVIRRLMDNTTTPKMPEEILVGFPSDLIRRRPDLAEAEQQIAVIASQLGVAKNDWLPALKINANVETSAHSFGDLFGFRSLHYIVEPQLSWTLFDGFSRQANIAQAKADMEAQIDSYNMTLLTAFQEVNSAIVNYESANRELELYKEVLSDTGDVLNLSTDRYKLGLTDFSDVATAQINMLTQQTSYESAKANAFNTLVVLYKALGGGWISSVDKEK